MAAKSGSGAGGASTSTEKAISELVKMEPWRVSVNLPLPLEGSRARPTLTLEWVRQDVNMPLSLLLHQIEAYIAEFGTA